MNTSLAAQGALAHRLQRCTACNAALPTTPHRLQRRTACKIQNGRQGAPKWLMGSGKGCTPSIWALPSTFAK